MQRRSFFQPDDTLDDKIQRILLVLMRLSLVIAIVWLGFQRDFDAMFITILALLLASIPKQLEQRFNVVFPIEFTMVIVAFTYLSTFLGEVGGAYERFWWWDTILHVSSGIILAFAGFLVLYSLYYQRKLRASPLLLSFFAVAFALGSGALWEIFEFAMDSAFGFNMQKNGLRDTMWDLIVDGLGGLIVAWLGYLYIAKGEKNFVSRLLENFFRHNPRFKKRRRWLP